jgi:hypothetical protein
VYALGNFSADLNYSSSWMSNSGKDINSSTTFAFGDGTATTTTSATARGTVAMAHDYEANVHYRFNLNATFTIRGAVSGSRDVQSRDHHFSQPIR